VTTQSEAGCDVSPARACVDCRGAKVLTVRPLDCLHGRNCDCDTAEVECLRCKGTGVEMCSGCAAPAVVTDSFGDWCSACMVAPSVACAICDAIDAAEAARRVA
jgi:hypothetical protein